MSFFLNPDLNIGKQQEFKGKKHFFLLLIQNSVE